MPGSVQLRWSDAWLLAAIYLSARNAPASLAEIIAAADAINRAIPNEEEVQGGLLRLEESGLIAQADRTLAFICTPRATSMIKPLAGARTPLFDIYQRVASALSAVHWQPGEPLPHPDNTLSYPGLATEIFKKAVKDYLRGAHL